MNTLREAVADYLTLRRNLGFKLRDYGNYLLDFVTFLEQRSATHISTSLALEWAQQTRSTRTTHWAQRMTMVRGFARYRRATDERTEIPPTQLFPFKRADYRARPYLYTESEILQLLESALCVPRTSNFKRQAYYCLFGLLAVSGMRISEALDLKVENVDLNAGVLTVKGKFERSRLIPLHASTLKVLASYMSVRNKYFGEQAADHVFISRQGTRLMGTQVRLVFHRLCRQAGLPRQDSKSRPRIHDLRHTFAVKTLLHWYHSGVDVEAHMPVLSTFLGHVNTKDTYWYLSSCPELMGEAVKRLENFWEVKS
jgi:integrase